VTTVRRVMVDTDPFVGQGSWTDRCHWPAQWVGPDADPELPTVVGYRLQLRLDGSLTARLHVSADERYELYVDGTLAGRGPDRGDLDHWNFESYDLELPTGEHQLAARVWSMGAGAPYAQFSRSHGFLVAAQDHPELSTGTGGWQAIPLPGHGFRDAGVARMCGLRFELDGRSFPWGWERGLDDLDWRPARVLQQACSRQFANEMAPNRLLVPTILPPQWEADFDGGVVRLVAEFPGGATAAIPIRAADAIPAEVAAWTGLLAGRPVTVEPNTCRRILLDLEQYVCGYPVLRLSGGRDAAVRVHWQEALFTEDGRKGNRDEIEGKRFRPIGTEDDGVGDVFIAGGGDEEHTALWWSAGRYVEITVETAGTPLTLAGLRFLESRYPYEDLSRFDSSDDRLDQVKRLGFRTLQMCSHETTMDCPFYEQLQYAGDTRIQCLVAYLTTGDDRLARQALLAFDRSRDTRGLTTSRYPSWVRQSIPPFSLWWVAMVHDFARWRGDLDFVRTLMPGVRAVLDAHRANVGPDGLFTALDGWNFTDWVGSWESGAPPSAHWGVSGILNLQLALVADQAAELEGWLDESHLAQRQAELAATVRTAAEAAFWSPERGLYADDLDHAHWSEHAQALALLAGAAHGAEAMQRALTEDGLARTTVYFDHYLFEALGQIGRTDVLLSRMGLWFGLVESGLRTVIEEPEPTRSDCHAWGAHPIYHLYATLLGVRPTSPGMATVSVVPQLGGLTHADGTLCTPYGPLRVVVDEAGLRTTLPPGMALTPS
jgi:alpha-L-rhamnosidase